MSKVVIVGGGPVGLASAILFGREGHTVTLLEKDGQPPPTSALGAWERWDRTGVAQFRQIHAMHARFRHIVDAEFPDVRDAIEASGGRRTTYVSGIFKSLPDSTPLPGDERFETVTARRPVVERAFAHAAENTPGVTIIRGTSVEGPIANGSESEGIPHVTGVRTKEGETFTADLVIDAMGRRSKFIDWVEAIGGRRPHEETSENGFAYYSRHYRCRDGFEPEIRTAPAILLDSFLTVSLPTDNETWGVAIVCMAADKPLKEIRHNDVWERVVRSVPHMAHWIDGDPIDDVLPMAGAMDRYRRFVLDGTPVVTGMVAVGDAWACTNPTAGRGVSLGLGHAIALRDVARNRFDDPVGLAIDFDAVTEERFAPWYRQQMDRDRDRIAVMQAAIEGRELPTPDPADPVARMQMAFQIAAAHDPEIARALAELISVLALPGEIMSRPGMIEKVLAASEGREAAPIPSPRRPELLKILASA